MFCVYCRVYHNRLSVVTKQTEHLIPIPMRVNYVLHSYVIGHK